MEGWTSEKAVYFPVLSCLFRIESGSETAATDTKPFFLSQDSFLLHRKAFFFSCCAALSNWKNHSWPCPSIHCGTTREFSQKYTVKTGQFGKKSCGFKKMPAKCICDDHG